MQRHYPYIEHKIPERHTRINSDALFFGAHPDDVELNCGGTLISLVNAGRKIVIADLTRGELSTRGTLRIREKETRAASEAMGISFRENLGLRDGGIKNDDASRLKIVRVIRKHRPDIVFAPYPHDRHPDHILAGELIRDAVFLSGLEKIVTAGLRSHRPSRTFYYRSASDIPVSFVFDISGTYDKKIEVLKCYRSQFHDPQSGEPETFISSKLFWHEIESRARHFGFKIGVEFGEPFCCFETLKGGPATVFSL